MKKWYGIGLMLLVCLAVVGCSKVGEVPEGITDLKAIAHALHVLAGAVVTHAIIHAIFNK